MMSQLPSKTVALEEHAIFPSLEDGHRLYESMRKAAPKVHQALQDHSAGRLAEMDAGHLTCQVMSHLPGIANDNIEGCRAANDEMAAAIKANPARFAGFAALPMSRPQEASVELERAVKELGFVGAMIDDHLEDMTTYDAEKFWTVFETAEKLDVPIYIHPAPCDEKTFQTRFAGNYSHSVAFALSQFGYGWHESLALHLLKLWSAGLFERFPKLKIIIGHMGELLPIWIDRVSNVMPTGQANQTKFEEIWKRNIWVTASGYFSLRTLEMLLKTTKLEHVMYSVDYPFHSNVSGWRFLEEIAKSGTLSTKELEMFAYGNAKTLLKLDV